MHTCAKQNLQSFLYALGEVFLWVRFGSPMGLYTPQYNHSSAYHWSDPLWSLIHVVHILALYNIQVGMIRCRSRICTGVFSDACPFCRNIPITFYYIDESLSRISRRRITNFDNFSQFIPILYMIICNNIIPVCDFQSTFGLNTTSL